MKDWLGRSEAQVRHEQRMALEHRRDRVESLRRQGYSEQEIRKAERSRSFRNFISGVVFVVGCALALLVIVAISSGNRSGQIAENEIAVMDSPEQPQELKTSNEDSFNENEFDNQIQQKQTPIGNSSEEVSEQEIIFVPKTVVQPISVDEDKNEMLVDEILPQEQLID